MMEREIKNFIDELTRLEQWHRKEYEYCRQSSWNTFSTAKGEYRWIRKYCEQIRQLNGDKDRSLSQFFQNALKLIEETTWDNDYFEPFALKNKIKKLIDSNSSE